MIVKLNQIVDLIKDEYDLFISKYAKKKSISVNRRPVVNKRSRK
jgi:hypothetical protein